MAFVKNRGTDKKPRWYCKYKDVDGKWKQRKTGQPTQGKALIFAAEVEARVARGRAGIPEPELPTPEEQEQKTLTVKALVDKFLKEYSRPKIRDIEVYRMVGRSIAANMLQPFALASILVAKLRRLDVERWRDALSVAGYSPHSINRALGVLGRAFNWAYEHEIIDDLRPVRRIEKMEVRASEEHYSLKEVHALLSRPDCPAMVWTALHSGMRKGELFGLTWPCVHLDGEIPYIDVKRSYDGPTKSGKPRVVPIHPDLLPILRAWQDECPKALHPGPALPKHAWVGGKDEPLVFPVEAMKPKGPAGEIRGTGRFRMGIASDMCGLVELLTSTKLLDDSGKCCHVPAEASARPGKEPKERAWHATRHSFATHFQEASSNGDALSKLLGHSLGGTAAKMTQGYTHTSKSYLLKYLHDELVKLNLLPPAAAGVTRIKDAPPRRRRPRAL